MVRNDKSEIRNALTWCLEHGLQKELEQIKEDLHDAESSHINSAEEIYAQCKDGLKTGLIETSKKTTKSRVGTKDDEVIHVIQQHFDKQMQSYIQKRHADLFEDLYRLIDSLMNEIMQKPGQPKKEEKEIEIPKLIQKRLQG